MRYVNVLEVLCERNDTKMTTFSANRHQIFQVPLQLKSGHARSKSLDIEDLLCVHWKLNSTPKE